MSRPKSTLKEGELVAAVLLGVWLTKEDADRVNDTPLITKDGALDPDKSGQYLMPMLLTQHYRIGPKIPAKGNWCMLQDAPYRSLKYPLFPAKQDENFALPESTHVFLGYRVETNVTLTPLQTLYGSKLVNWPAISNTTGLVSAKIRAHGVEVDPLGFDLEAALFMLPIDAGRFNYIVEKKGKDISDRLKTYTGQHHNTI